MESAPTAPTTRWHPYREGATEVTRRNADSTVVVVHAAFADGWGRWVRYDCVYALLPDAPGCAGALWYDTPTGKGITYSAPAGAGEGWCVGLDNARDDGGWGVQPDAADRALELDPDWLLAQGEAMRAACLAQIAAGESDDD